MENLTAELTVKNIGGEIGLVSRSRSMASKLRRYGIKNNCMQRNPLVQFLEGTILLQSVYQPHTKGS